MQHVLQSAAGTPSVCWTLLLCAALASCSTQVALPAAHDTQPHSLAATSWQLVQFQSMDDAQGTTRATDPALYTVSFGSSGKSKTMGSATLRLNCNRAVGPWQAEPSADGLSGQLRFGPLAGTRALCPPPSLDEKLLRDLQHVRSYVLRNGQLHMALWADGGIYSWKPAPAQP